MASFSSSGPTFIDFDAKPDLVAPGIGTISLAVPGSTFYATKAAYLLAGKLALGSKPYLSAERHQHGGAGRQRHGRADAAGEPEPDAEPDQGDSAVPRRCIRATARCGRAPASSTRSARCAWRSST